jgi:hypothetical protein
VTDPYDRILGFLEGAATFLSSSSSVLLTRLSEPRSRSITFFSGSAGKRIRASGSVAKNFDHYKNVKYVMRDSLYIFIDYVVKMMYQQMSHALKTIVLVKIEILTKIAFLDIK